MLENDYGQHSEVSSRYKSGVNWFYWIAGLTLVTSIIGLLGGGWRFFLSLEITQLIDGLATVLAEQFGDATKVIALVVDIFIGAMFAGLGYLASKRQMWAYLLGMVVFVFDGLVSLALFDLLGIIVHVFVLVMMIRGYLAGREMLALERAMAEAAQSAQATAQAPEPAPASTF